jgi:hypothetical protein
VATATRRIVAVTIDSLWGFLSHLHTDDAQNGYGDRSDTDQVGGVNVTHATSLAFNCVLDGDGYMADACSQGRAISLASSAAIGSASQHVRCFPMA